MVTSSQSKKTPATRPPQLRYAQALRLLPSSTQSLVLHQAQMVTCRSQDALVLELDPSQSCRKGLHLHEARQGCDRIVLPDVQLSRRSYVLLPVSHSAFPRPLGSRSQASLYTFRTVDTRRSFRRYQKNTSISKNKITSISKKYARGTGDAYARRSPPSRHPPCRASRHACATLRCWRTASS